MAKVLKIQCCQSAKEWDCFIRSSPQNNIFLRDPFLSALGVDYERWFVLEGGNPVAAAIILQPSKENFKAPHDYTLYQGIAFAPENVPVHSKVSKQLKTTGYLCKELTARYRNISFCLHHSIHDLRALQWLNYHKPEQGQFKIELYYTALLDLQGIGSFEEYLKNIRESRFYEYKKAKSRNYSLVQSTDLEVFLNLYKDTFKRQELELPAYQLNTVSSIARRVLDERFGKMDLCVDENGEPASATIFLYDENCAYYLFGANAPAYRNTGASTYLLLENIRYFRDLGFHFVDFIGVNSPNRGDYKTSYNAIPVPFFTATWRSPLGIV